MRECGRPRAPAGKAGSGAPVPPPRVEKQARPRAVFSRLGIRQRRPVGGTRLRFRPCVPRTDSAIEIGGLVRPVGPGRKTRRSPPRRGVLALLRALGVAVAAAPLAEEVALEPFAICASAATALCDQRSPPAPTTPCPLLEAPPARSRVLPVLFDIDGISAAFLDAARAILAEGFGVRDVRRKGAAQLGEHMIEVHGGLPLRRGVRRCLSGGTRAGRSPRASEVGARDEPSGLTGRARVPR